MDQLSLIGTKMLSFTPYDVVKRRSKEVKKVIKDYLLRSHYSTGQGNNSMWVHMVLTKALRQTNERLLTVS